MLPLRLPPVPSRPAPRSCDPPPPSSTEAPASAEAASSAEAAGAAGDASTAETHALRLPAEEVSVPRARHAMERWLGRIGASSELRDQAGLVLSELVTNAVKHTDSRWVVCATSYSPYDGIRLEVHDDDTSARTPRRSGCAAPEEEKECGRGLYIVEALAERWGVAVSPVTRGSAVWAEIRGN